MMKLNLKSGGVAAGVAGLCLALAGNCGAAKADVLVFDLENQIAAPNTKAEGRLTFLELRKDDFSLQITRPGSAFDLVPPFTDDWYRRPDSWGAVSLSSFFDAEGDTPLNINFSAPVSGFSLWMGDHGQDTDRLEIEAFSQPDGAGQSLGRVTRRLESNDDDKFSFEKLSVRATAIRSVRVIGGSAVWPHSMFYDQLTVDTAPAPSSE